MNRCLLRMALAVVVIQAGCAMAWGADKDTDAIREAPKVLRPGDLGVGQMIPDVPFTTIDGKSGKLSDFKGKKALVIALTSTSCPLCLKYAPSLARLEKAYADKDVAFLFVSPIASDKDEDLKKAMASHGYKGLLAPDRDGKFQQALQAHTTTEVFVLDPARTVLYRGAIDDQYGLGYAKDAPQRNYLSDALDAFLANRPVPILATSAPGCPLEAKPAKAADVTYYNQVSRLMLSNCVDCHRQGGVAPFALDSYEEVVAHAPQIRRVLNKGTMPPWFAVPTEHDQNKNPWGNDRSLTARHKDLILNWVQGDKEKGDPKDAPLARTYPDGWLIGKPDAIVQIAKPFKVKADGTMPYQNAFVETNFEEDKWVQAIEVQPTARQVVHHVLVFAFPPSKNAADRVREITDERSGFFGVYVPGNSTLIYPDGFAKKLPKGARIQFQIHYTPNGTATEDQTKLGMVFAKKPPQYEVRNTGIADTHLNIPPGADNHPESTTLKVPVDVHVLGFLPHMHLRGKAFRYEATTPDGKTATWLDIPRYDFNWQLVYRYAEPQLVKKGTVIKVTGWFDNSKDNPANPDPAKTVHWGPQTYDEMLLGYVEYYVEGGQDDDGLSNPISHVLDPEKLFKRLDADGDGKVSREEFKGLLDLIPALKNNPRAIDFVFDRLDANKDGSITMEELKAILTLLRGDR